MVRFPLTYSIRCHLMITQIYIVSWRLEIISRMWRNPRSCCLLFSDNNPFSGTEVEELAQDLSNKWLIYGSAANRGRSGRGGSQVEASLRKYSQKGPERQSIRSLTAIMTLAMYRCDQNVCSQWEAWICLTCEPARIGDKMLTRHGFRTYG